MWFYLSMYFYIHQQKNYNIVNIQAFLNYIDFMNNYSVLSTNFFRCSRNLPPPYRLAERINDAQQKRFCMQVRGL